MPGSPVQLYALSTCVHCRHAREFLETNNIAFKCVYVDRLSGEERRRALDRIREYNPKVSFPTLVANDGNTVIVGFKKDEIVKIL